MCNKGFDSAEGSVACGSLGLSTTSKNSACMLLMTQPINSMESISIYILD